jgi:predicted TIM-barrel fold metal-dependent hydrolase
MQEPALPKLKHSGAVDADGHILEPPDLWERYLEPAYRSRALRIGKDEQGLEYLEIDGASSRRVRRGMPAGLGAMDLVGGFNYEREPTGVLYVDHAPFGAMDPGERVRRLDIEGIERVFIYPTLGVLWVAECEDEDLTQAYARAYNRFVMDFCGDSDGRLVPIAQISLGDPAAAEKEVHRVAEAGAKGIWVPPFTHTRLGIGHPDHDRVFAAAAECNLPLGIHPSFEPSWTASGRFQEMRGAQYSFFENVTAADAVRHAFTSFFQYGVFEKFPSLKLVILESGASWLGYWLDRMDAVYDSPQGILVRERLKERPSVYFKRQCWISADPDETTLPGVMAQVGPERFFWASDFPHPDHAPDYVPNMNQLVTQLPEASRPGFLGRNVLDAYGLD